MVTGAAPEPGCKCTWACKRPWLWDLKRRRSSSPLLKFKSSRRKSRLTLVKQGEALGLVGAIRVEVEYDEVARDVHHLSRRAAPVEAHHHLVGVTVQQLHHIGLVRDVEKGEVEEDGGRSGDLDGPVANAAGAILVREVRGVDHPRWGGVVPPACPHSSCKEERYESEILNQTRCVWSRNVTKIRA